MPPPPGQKGTGKKGRDAARQSRSRNSTPGSSFPLSDTHTAFLDLPIKSFQTSDDLNETYGTTIPSSRDLEALLERLNKLTGVVDTRGTVCDRGMRLLSQARKDRLEELESERRDEERKEQLKKDAADEEERGRNKASKIKKRKDLSTAREAREAREERPLTHGAHGLAPQDGSNLERTSPIHDKKPRKMSINNDSASSSLSPVAQATPTATGMEMDDNQGRYDDDSSSDEHQPPPAAPIPHLQTFGDDPSTFPDPTIYEIREVTKDMTIEQKKEIYSVAQFPQNNLEDLIPGSPPDKDFSNAKPTNQVQANTFATYLEPYFRPFTEEDLAFLRERGDRVSPFTIPRRGKKHYTEVWAEEDGALSIDGSHHNRDRLPANQARGSIENLTDDLAETDEVSAGPILSRLLATMRPEHRAPSTTEEKPATNGLSNGEMNGIGDANNDLAELSAILSDAPAPVPPATFMAESNSEAWKKATHPKLDHAQVDERIKQELRHIGFMAPDAEPDYDAHFDDEVAARLRFLQAKLKETSIKNGAMKARVSELVKERMAHQEFTTITEDLDTQVQAHYLKRTRTLGKNKKSKRPGGAGGGSHFVSGGNTNVARPGIGEVTKGVMDKRGKWINTIGVVLDKDANKVRRNKDPGSSIFKPEDVADLLRKEKEIWDEDADED